MTTYNTRPFSFYQAVFKEKGGSRYPASIVEQLKYKL